MSKLASKEHEAFADGGERAASGNWPPWYFLTWSDAEVRFL